MVRDSLLIWFVTHTPEGGGVLCHTRNAVCEAIHEACQLAAMPVRELACVNESRTI